MGNTGRFPPASAVTPWWCSPRMGTVLIYVAGFGLIIECGWAGAFFGAMVALGGVFRGFASGWDEHGAARRP